MTNLFHKFIGTIAIIAGLCSCEESYDPVLSESPDERVKQALTEYQQLLLEAPFGWKANLQTGVGVTYLYYFDFDENGKVTMMADFNETTASEPASGEWALKALQQPTLSFDTYSYIHLPADPDGSISGGNYGEGLVSDFEFEFSSVGEDTLKLSGIQRGASMTLVPATEQEKTVLVRGEIKNMLHYISGNSSTYLQLPSSNNVTLAFSLASKMVYALYLSEDKVTIERKVSAFSFTTDGIQLQNPMKIQGFSIQELTWDGEKGLYTVGVESNNLQLHPIEDTYYFNPQEPLASAIGKTYTTIQIPAGSGNQPLPGQSQEFTYVYNRTVDNLRNSEYGLMLHDITMKFDTVTSAVTYDMLVSQNSTLFLCRYIYSYTINEDGTATFMFNAADDNGWTLFSYVTDLLTYFDNNTFKLQYIGGGQELIGGVFCQEVPDFYFSGYLKKE